MIERLIDAAARRHGFDPIELRRRNLVRGISLPQGARHGDRLRPLRRQPRRRDRCCRPRRFRRHAAQRPRQRGLLRGIGITCFMETARGAPNEGAELRFDDDGTRGAAGRHAIQRHGARNHLCADRRRSAGAADRDRSATCRRTPRWCAPATAMAARDRCTWAARHCAGRWTRCSPRAARSRRGCCRPRLRRWCSPMAGSLCGTTRPAPSICSQWRAPRGIPPICRTAPIPASTPMSGTCSTSSPSRTDATSPRWRSIRKPAPSHCFATPRWTISAR